MNQIEDTQGNGRQPSRQLVGREVILEAISREQALLVRLEREQADSRARLAGLRADLASLGVEPKIRVHLPLPVEGTVPRTSRRR